MAEPALFCFNVGSSSLGFALFEDGAPAPALTGGIDLSSDEDVRVERPGRPAGRLDVADPWDFAAVARAAMALAPKGTVAVHRIVHGGDSEADAAWLDAAEIERLGALTSLAPLHQPANLAPIRALAASEPGRRQIAVFDTAFHRTLPEVARRLPMGGQGPFAGLRRYGFHGLSHGWAARRAAAHAPGARRVVSLHLSGGCSACAILDGRSIDTTMGATPLDGLIMGTRSGSVDPGALLHALQGGMAVRDLADLLWQRSGLLGLSGVSADLRDLLPREEEPQVGMAIALYCRRAAGAVADMAVALGGLDALVFTGGAGVGQPGIRRRIASHLAWIGLKIDEDANERSTAVISTPESACAALVVTAEEERMMADIARRLLAER